MAAALVEAVVANFLRQSALNLFTPRVKHEVRTATYQRMQRLDVGFFDRARTGELMSILINDTDRLEVFLDEMMSSAIRFGVLVGASPPSCCGSTRNRPRWRCSSSSSPCSPTGSCGSSSSGTPTSAGPSAT
jgi:hypothetical protein